MPDYLTHIVLADEVLKRIESRRIYEGVDKKRPLYYLGAQGPDPLFFYNFYKSKSKSPLMGLGTRMHNQRTGDFLLYGFKRLQNVSYDREWTNLAVYLCGFICHFTLDRMAHPYVNWACNKWIWGMDGTPRRATHQQVEISLDSIYWREVKKKHAYKERTRLLTDIGKAWPVGVDSFLKEGFSEVYGIEASDKDINKILKDFYKGHDLLYDPRNWKKAFINWLDNFTGGGVKPPKIPYPVSSDSEIDWANRKKRTWENPAVPAETSSFSVDEILQVAADTASNHINMIFGRIFKNEDIRDLFPNLSYITGLDVGG
ncbi:MAG: zinc dependent phospholipase C family protein [Acetivibrionales bacterium]|jgi:hypothetical protein|nr:zinc dependent phospholipase C family protein [Clostridiaceae bacterium]